MITAHFAVLIAVLPTSASSQPMQPPAPIGRLTQLGPDQLQSSLNPVFDGGTPGIGAPAVVAPAHTAETLGLVSAGNLSIAAARDRSERTRREPPAPLANMPGAVRAIEAIGATIPALGDMADKGGKILEAEGERRAREGAQRQREMEEEVTGRKSNKYPQYPDRTDEERKKDNGKYPKFD